MTVSSASTTWRDLLQTTARCCSGRDPRVCAALALAVLGTAGSGVAAAAPPASFAADPGAGGLSIIEARQADQRAQLCSSANAVGVGLKGEYFGRAGFKGPVVLTRIDTVIDFDSSLDWPAERRASAPMSVRWTGWVKAPLSGRYRVHVQPSNAVVTLANRTQAGDSAAGELPIEMAAGRFYPITIELAQPMRRGEVVRLEWTAPHGARFVVPRQSLFMPTDTVQSATAKR